MDATVITGPWAQPVKTRGHFGLRKVELLQGGLSQAVDASRDRVKDAARAAARAAKAELEIGFTAKIEFAAALLEQLADEAHTLRNGRAATKLTAFAEQLETLAAECEP